MDQARSTAAATPGDPDGQHDPTFCDCGQLDISAVLAACSPESLARLREPISVSFLQINLPFHRSPESPTPPCALFRYISTLHLRWSIDFVRDFGYVEVRIYVSNSSSRAAADVDPDLDNFAPFPMIAFAPGSPPGRSARWSEYTEFALPRASSTELEFPAEPTQGLGQHTWEVHNECALKEKPNWEGIKMALSVCRTKHSDSCGKPGPQYERMPTLLVIDCANRCLIPLSDDMVTQGAEYVTLSYVWGAATETPNILPGSSIPTDIPLVVSDAISACLQIGFQYLWVDRYCILQNDDESKHTIRNMNLIYKQSALTIIAAAGFDPSYGLPGVSRDRPAPKRSRLKMGPHSLVPIVRDAQLHSTHNSRMESFAGSTWNSRGWTYQEAVVSPRRLVFTDNLVVFQCWEAKWDERFSRPVPTTPAGYLSRRLGVPQLFPHGPIGFDASDFGNHATEYFDRQFTYMSDQLVAFQGILQEFALSPAALRHFSAVPIYGPWSSLSAAHFQVRRKCISRLSEKLMSLLAGKARLPYSRAVTLPTLAGFVPGLCWDLEPKIASGVRVSVRRNEASSLPSWSWLGWRAASSAYKVCFPLDREHAIFSAGDFPDNYTLLVREIRVSYGRPGKEIPAGNCDPGSPLDMAVNNLCLDILSLFVTGWVFEARYRERPGGDTPLDGYDRAPYHATLVRTDRAADKPYKFDLVQPRDTRDLASQTATFLVMFSVEDGRHWHTVCLALQPCLKHGNGQNEFFERIGLLYLHRQRGASDESYSRHSPANWKQGSQEETMFMESIPSEACRMTSLYLC